ncbi:putative receptor-like protein kinase At3g47110 isoform X5 [Rhododendron vialii]|uniref:putative receptor-like protein kinase At3g47110 isoform X5 n=1 Tax=Rhododendron vialii TaxID=182163 RepID=UPI00265E2385|nr:putative receptor-like protein kinase At3g47110 isoform X5 [Rhododendron vialii]
MGPLPPPSFSPFLFMFFVLLLLVGSVPDSVHYGNETDRLALLAFKAEITGDPLRVLSSWNGSVHFCQWVGVTCGRRHQRVTRLILSYAKLTGSISPHIGNLSFLMILSLKNNSLSHDIPQQIGNLRRLKFMTLYNNLVTGEIPANLSRCSNLVDLEFTANRLTGKIPTELGRLSKLKRLYVGKNNLTGGTGEADDLSFLSSLINATELNAFELSSNGFGGVFPEAITNFSIRLSTIYLGDNNLYGSIPRGIGNLVNLQLLETQNNHLTGNIPADFGKLQDLHQLFIGGNRFYGDIPSSFGNLSLLLTLDLSENNLQGSIPSSLSKCQMLMELTLAKNSLSGTIPKGVISLSSLFSLDLSHNNLTGVIPLEIGVLKNLVTLNVSENLLVGNIPSSLGSCVKLASLNLKGNKFWGVLPSTLSQLRGLEDLDISINDFSGKIPDYLEGFHFLQKLNISFNDFDGEVPKQGIFTIAAAISVEGNKKLCGGIPDLKLRNCQSKGFTRKKFTQVVKLVLPSSFGLVCLLLMIYFVYLRWFKKKTEVRSFSFFGHSFPMLSYRSLLKATNGFSSANLIGMGSFGSVYKGIVDLDQSEKLVAVKVLNLQSGGAAKSFIAECKALRSIRHRNLVHVLTACSSVDYKGDEFKALVYDFMVNGSLEEWLHPNEKEDDAHNKSQSLNLLKRLNIAFDVASALFYLHHHCSEPIVHCDLKPSNVLLDDEMVGHVGDFGLARFLVDATCIASANQSSSIGLRGSSGYAAPEYGMGNEVSTSGDMYSFGILLLEMFTGKRPTDAMFEGSLTLHNFVKMAMAEQVTNIADPTLFQQVVMGEKSSSINSSQNQSPASIHEVRECLISILKVGIACSEELPRDRPDIEEIITQLHVIKNTLLGVGVHGGMRASIAA